MIRIKNTMSKAEVAVLDKEQFHGRIYLIYTEEDARKAVDYLNRQLVVGMDTESRPAFKKGQVFKVALLQVATLDTCFLFRLNRIGMPGFLRDFLTNNVLKVGLSLRDDLSRLQRQRTIKAEEGNYIELQDYVGRFGIKDRGLKKLYANLFGKKISKSQQLTNWEAESLTEKQMIYAATDAWASLRIYKKLAEMERTGDYEVEIVQQEQTEPEVKQ